MIYGAATTLDGADDASTLLFNSAAAGNASQVVSARFKGKQATNVSQVVIAEVLNPGTTDWTSTGCIDMKALAIVAAGNIAVTNSTDFDYMIPDVGATWGARLRVVSIGSGSHACTPTGLFATEVPRSFLPVTLAAATSNVSSNSATALTVGPNGTTNPAFSVDASAASLADGWKITGNATGTNAKLVVISSATNEGGSIDAKGTGVLALSDTSTGGVGLNRGSRQALMVGKTLTSIGTSQSSTPTSAQLLGGILTQTGATGAGTITLPTGTALSTACPRTPATGDSFEVVFVNAGGGQTLTVTGATGTTVVGGAAIPTATTATLTFYCTGANAWSIYCTPGV